MKVETKITLDIGKSITLKDFKNLILNAFSDCRRAFSSTSADSNAEVVQLRNSYNSPEITTDEALHTRIANAALASFEVSFIKTHEKR